MNLGWDKEKIEEFINNDKPVVIIDEEYFKDNFISKDKIRHILLKFQNEYGEGLEITDRLFIGKEVVQYGEDIIDEIAKELDIELLEEDK